METPVQMREGRGWAFYACLIVFACLGMAVAWWVAQLKHREEQKWNAKSWVSRTANTAAHILEDQPKIDPQGLIKELVESEDLGIGILEATLVPKAGIGPEYVMEIMEIRQENEEALHSLAVRLVYWQGREDFPCGAVVTTTSGGAKMLKGSGVDILMDRKLCQPLGTIYFYKKP